MSCSIIGENDGPPTFIFTAEAFPTDGGAISPDSTGFEEGEAVSAEANPAEGYRFENWTGDISSDENPLNFEITEDTDVTANFSQISSRYGVEMTVADDSDSMLLKFGQNTSSSDEFDEGNDKESPPPPPEGSLHSYFHRPDKDLLYDYRSDKAIHVVWDMRYQVGSGDTLQLSWNIDITSLEGNLILRDEDSSISVDMTNESSVNVPVSDSGTLTIEYEIVN
jgi:hypothetical protein